MKKKFIRKVGLNLPLDITVPYPAISAAGESDGGRGGGGHCKPSPVSFMAEALETFGYFAFFIAQNIT